MPRDRKDWLDRCLELLTPLGFVMLGAVLGIMILGLMGACLLAQHVTK